MKTALIASWATIDHRHATIGDRLAVQVVIDALGRAGVPTALPSRDQFRAGQLDLSEQAILVWVCGPIDFSYDKQQEILGRNGTGWVITDATLITTDLSAPVQADISTIRDGPGRPTSADFAVLAPPENAAQIAAVILRGHQPEYRQAPSVHHDVEAAVAAALNATLHYQVPLSTRNQPGIPPGKAAAALEFLLQIAAVVITSRLHGIVHAVRAGVLPIVIDEIIGGGKITACATAFGLPVLSPGPDLAERLIEALANHEQKSHAETADICEQMRRSAEKNLEKLVRVVTTQAQGGVSS
jgi:hypothetical protein